MSMSTSIRKWEISKARGLRDGRERASPGRGVRRSRTKPGLISGGTVQRETLSTQVTKFFETEQRLCWKRVSRHLTIETNQSHAYALWQSGPDGSNRPTANLRIADGPSMGLLDAIEHALRQIPEADLGVARAIFCWTILRSGQITETELVEALALGDNPKIEPVQDKETLRLCVERIKSASAGLVTFDQKNRLQFVDPATKEHLLSGKSLYNISVADADEFLARSSWTYLRYGNMEQDLQSPSVPRSSVANYFVENCVSHTLRAEARGKNLTDSVLEFVENDFQGFKAWCQEYSKAKCVPFSSLEIDEKRPLSICAKFGFYRLALMLLNRGVGTDMCSTLGLREALNIAFKNGHSDVATLLYFAGRASSPSDETFADPEKEALSDRIMYLVEKAAESNYYA